MSKFLKEQQIFGLAIYTLLYVSHLFILNVLELKVSDERRNEDDRDVLHQLVAHARPPTEGEGLKVFGPSEDELFLLRLLFDLIVERGDGGDPIQGRPLPPLLLLVLGLGRRHGRRETQTLVDLIPEEARRLVLGHGGFVDLVPVVGVEAELVVVDEDDGVLLDGLAAERRVLGGLVRHDGGAREPHRLENGGAGPVKVLRFVHGDAVKVFGVLSLDDGLRFDRLAEDFLLCLRASCEN